MMIADAEYWHQRCRKLEKDVTRLRRAVHQAIDHLEANDLTEEANDIRELEEMEDA